MLRAGADRLVICHWSEGGHWDAVEVAHSGLNGHEQHGLDIWPPVPEVTEGHNWPVGQAVYLNGCAIQAAPSPSPSPAPTDLPSTGSSVEVLFLLLAVLMIAAGSLLLVGRGRVNRR